MNSAGHDDPHIRQEPARAAFPESRPPSLGASDGLAAGLEALYDRCNRRRFVHPDPLECLYRFDAIRDREIVGLIASSLAYGRVTQIVKSVDRVLGEMNGSPFLFLRRTSRESIRARFAGFQHRFTTGEELARMLLGIRAVLERHGSLYACFSMGYQEGHPTVLPALTAFVQALFCEGGACKNSLLPLPERGSACKRLHLYLRWMVREDAVDPGGWRRIPASKLLIPLDTHMHRIALALGLTNRRTADLRTALDITRAFQRFSPDDPARYDFCLTRLGIRDDLDLEEMLAAAFPGGPTPKGREPGLNSRR